MITRKERWTQFLMLVVSIGMFLTGNISWWVMKDDEGHECYTWQTKVLGIVIGLVVCSFLIYLSWVWLLKWEVKWS